MASLLTLALGKAQIAAAEEGSTPGPGGLGPGPPGRLGGPLAPPQTASNNSNNTGKTTQVGATITTTTTERPPRSSQGSSIGVLDRENGAGSSLSSRGSPGSSQLSRSLNTRFHPEEEENSRDSGVFYDDAFEHMSINPTCVTSEGPSSASMLAPIQSGATQVNSAGHGAAVASGVIISTSGIVNRSFRIGSANSLELTGGIDASQSYSSSSSSASSSSSLNPNPNYPQHRATTSNAPVNRGSKVIADITSHFNRRTPTPPIPRQRSPKIEPTADVPQPTYSTEFQLQHNDDVTAFLGEVPSLHGSLFMASGEAHIMMQKSPSDQRLQYLREQRTYQRAQSLESLDGIVEQHPLMIALPTPEHGSDVSEFWSKIPNYAWMLPYVFSYSHNDMIRYFKTLSPIYHHGFNTSDKLGNSAQSSEGNVKIESQSKASRRSATPLILPPGHLSDHRDRNNHSPPTTVHSQAHVATVHGSKDDSCIGDVSQAAFFYDHNVRLPDNSNAHTHAHIHTQASTGTVAAYATIVETTASDIPTRPLSALPSTDSASASSSSTSFAFPSSSSSFAPAAASSNLMDSWQSLDALYVSRDPDWSPWELRNVYLCDNYLFEVTPDGSKIIGYAQLSGSKIVRKWHEPEEVEEHEKQAPSTVVLMVTCNCYSRVDSPTVTFYLRTVEAECMEALEKALVRAAKMTVEDVYDLAGPGEVLGRGRFNEVRKARRKHGSMGPSAFMNTTHPSSTSADYYFALKLVSKEIFWTRVTSGKERSDGLVREVIAQSIVCHYGKYFKSFQSNNSNNSASNSNNNADVKPASSLDIPIVQIFGAFETTDGFALELELMEHIDLFEKLSKDGLFNESEVRRLMYQITEAVLICSRVGIAHRDVKLSNITFPVGGSQGSHNLKVKLADFGMAGFVSDFGGANVLRGRCGTPGYVAPDILKAGVNEGYGFNVDMFSVGVVAYILLCGYEPFYGDNDQELIRSNRNVDYEFIESDWRRISPQAKEWIARTLTTQASVRMKPEEALEHPWLAGLHAAYTSKDR